MRLLRYLGSLERWAVYALFGLLPIFFVPVAWVSIAQSKTLLVATLVVLGFVALAAAAIERQRLELPRSGLLAAAGLIPLAYLISAVASGASWASFVGNGNLQNAVAGVFMVYIAAILVAVQLAAYRSQGIERLAIALRLFLIGMGAVVLVQFLRLVVPSFNFGGALPAVTSSVVGSWHDLALMLGLALFVTLALFRAHTSVFARASLGALAFISSALLVIASYSDVWLGVAGLALFFAAHAYRLRPIGASVARAITLPVLGAALAVGLYFGGAYVQPLLPPSFQVTQFEVRPSWQGTFAVGERVFTQPLRVFFGSGPNTFSREWALSKPLSVNTTQFWNTDFYSGVGFVPTTVVTTGVFGFLGWAAIGVALLAIFVRMLRHASDASRVGVVLLGSAIYLAAYHILYVPGPAVSVLTFLALGALAAYSVSMGGRVIGATLSLEAWRDRITVLTLALAASLVLFSGVQVSRAVVSDLLVNRAVTSYNATGAIEPASRSVALATRVLPGNDRAHRAGVELGLIQLSQLIAAGETTESAALQQALTGTIEHGLRAVSIENRSYLNWLTLARLYGELAGAGLEGAELSARSAYAEARNNNPTNPLPLLGEAQLDLEAGDDAAARETLQAALEIKPDLASAHFLLSQIEARAGDLALAAEYAATAVQLAPDDPLGWYNLGAVLHVSGDHQSAIMALEQAVAREGNYANALFLLGLSYNELGRTDDALRVLRQAQVQNPDNERLADTIRQIESGTPDVE